MRVRFLAFQSSDVAATAEMYLGSKHKGVSSLLDLGPKRMRPAPVVRVKDPTASYLLYPTAARVPKL